MPIATLGDVGIHFELHGSRGEPLVLVHGYTGDSSDWRHQVAAFAATHRVLVMDHRGHGRSQAPAERSAYTIDRMTDDLEALIAHLGLERFHLVGHSMGGAIAQELALRSPNRLRSLTLEDTGPAFEIMRNPGVMRDLRSGLPDRRAAGNGCAGKARGRAMPPAQEPATRPGGARPARGDVGARLRRSVARVGAVAGYKEPCARAFACRHS